MIVRAMTSMDLSEARSLLAQLGYPLTPEEVAFRFRTVTSDPDHAVFVADAGGAACGLAHVYERSSLDKPPEAVVQALVVDSALHGRGIGRRLMAEVERWASARGLRSVCLSSHVSRDDAHAFYRSLGYEIAANALWLRKSLG